MTPTKTISKPKAKPKPKKIMLHSRHGFPMTPHRTQTTRLTTLRSKPKIKVKPKRSKPKIKVKPKFPIVHRKKSVKGKDLVSILILNYNTIEVLQPCVRSILKHTVHPYELIVV
ncbi:unnamed protein product, partial [marine sediment metagenome]